MNAASALHPRLTSISVPSDSTRFLQQVTLQCTMGAFLSRCAIPSTGHQLVPQLQLYYVHTCCHGHAHLLLDSPYLVARLYLTYWPEHSVPPTSSTAASAIGSPSSHAECATLMPSQVLVQLEQAAHSPTFLRALSECATRDVHGRSKQQQGPTAPELPAQVCVHQRD